MNLEDSRTKSFCPSMSSILLLQPEIMLNIFSRLPVVSVLQCRRVCKVWRDLRVFDDKYFGEMHLRHLLLQQQDEGAGDSPYNSSVNNGNLCFLFSGYSFLHTLEIDEESRNKVRKINVPLPSTSCAVVGSCNGLVCLAKKNKLGYFYPAYICNPITKERINLPLFVTEKEEKDARGVLSGFGYVPSTDEYKVVSIIYYGNEDLLGHVHVYTLGDRSGWRDKEETHYQLSNQTRNNVLANGALHWLDSQGNIVAFSLDKEEFQLLSTPPCLPTFDEFGQIFTLCVLGGCLCVFHQQRRHVGDANIWILKKKITGDCRVKEQQDYDSLSWNKEFTLSFGSLSCSDKFTLPFAITKRGEVLISLFESGKSIICWEPNTSTVKGRWELDQILFRFEAAPHMHSFVLLKECIRRKVDRDLNASK